MIEIVCSRELISVKGHAGYAEKGKDIVCSAISALTYTLMNGINEIGGTVTENGDMIIIDAVNPREITDIIFGIFVNGYRQIAEKYPDNVKIYGNIKQ